MANEINNDNIVLVNAPAGSGKTYRIKSEIRDYIIKNPKDQILCITYTNRAAEELLRDIDSSNVYISTIHSYINDMISPLFKKQELIDLYFEIYTDSILKRISDPEKQESNTKYKDKYGDISLGIIKQNIKAIWYNETQFNSLYYGGLSHDDLLLFTFKVLEKYPKLYHKISKRFKRIIIDEYQDTSSEVLEIFFNAVKNTELKLYLYGDKMQQIYKSYSSEFKDKFALIKKEDRKIINHRSIPIIVDILNKIYNNTKLDQSHFDKLKNIKPDFAPRIVIGQTTDLDKIINKNLIKDPTTLILYIFNRERFEKIGSGRLYNKFNQIDKYGFGKKVSVTKILLNGDEIDNPDDLLKFLIIMYKANNYWQKKIYGSFLKKCRENKKIFNVECVTLKKATDKITLFNLWKDIFDEFNSPHSTIGQLIDLMDSKNILEKSFIDTIISDKIYTEVLDVPVNELINLEKSNDNPNVSTQHGVKGESHESVLFVAEDSKRNDPRVYMYDFFRVWSQAEFSLDNFEDFYFEYLVFCKEVMDCLDFEIKKIKSKELKEHKEFLLEKSKEILLKFNKSNIFNILCSDEYKEYITNPTCKNAKKCFNESMVLNVLNAYRLFYVGCSRARKNLTVFVNQEIIENFKEDFENKVKKMGFQIVNPCDI